MAIQDYGDYDALGLAELVSKGEVSPEELLEEAIARVQAVNPKINAVIWEGHEPAREMAKQLPDAASPFRGVPFLLKDILGFCLGFPTTAGSEFIPTVPSFLDSELVVRYKKAGLVPFGKTNAPEFGIVNTTEPARYGPTRNPWDLERTPGGSSGGSAAAVAARIVPMAHANDGGGSIRIPAACCGLVGLKPTRARNPLGPMLGDVMGGMVAEHVVSRTVRDTAAALDVTAGPDLGDPYYAPPQPESYLAEVSRDPGKLRIVVLARSEETTVGEHARSALDDTIQLLEGLGHEVEEIDPPEAPPFAKLETADFMTLWCAGLSAGIDGFGELMGRVATKDDLEPLTWAMHQLGSKATASEFLRAKGKIQAFARFFAGVVEPYDVVLSQTLNQPPLPLGTIDVQSDDVDAQLAKMTDFTPLTALYNLTGCPAISLPLAWVDDRLPLGMMFGGKFGGEAELLRLAGQLEQERPWKDRKPPVNADDLRD